MMKILQLTTHLDYGGIPAYVVTLSKALSQMGHEPLVVSSGGPMAQELDRAGVLHVEFNLRTKSEISPRMPLALLKLAGVIRDFHPDVIHAHTRITQVLAHLASRLTGVPYVSTCHGFFRPRGARRKFGCWGERTIAISAKVKEHLLFDFGVAQDRIQVIYNGIDLRKFDKPLSSAQTREYRRKLGLDGHRVVGIIARLSSVKGHEYLLRAMEKVASKRKDVKLLVVGDGSRKSNLLKEVRSLGIEGKVLFAESTPFVALPLSVMDVFVLPSVKEGLGLSILEAMAANVPVVASKVGGITEVIDDGRTGVLVPPKDPGALADAIDFLLERRARAETMAHDGRAAVFERFGLDAMARNVIGVYKEVLSDQCSVISVR